MICENPACDHDLAGAEALGTLVTLSTTSSVRRYCHIECLVAAHLASFAPTKAEDREFRMLVGELPRLKLVEGDHALARKPILDVVNEIVDLGLTMDDTRCDAHKEATGPVA